MEIDDLRKEIYGKILMEKMEMLLTYAVSLLWKCCRLHGLKAWLVIRLVWRYHCLHHQCSKMQRLVVWQTLQMMLLFWGLDHPSTVCTFGLVK
jgi:hypothetical protein